jgi:IclR family transcriptional regulator, KDG regulon repressor
MRNDEVAVTLTVCKALDILDCLSKEGAPLPTKEIARSCGISRPTAYRLLSTLTAYGYVTRDRNQDERYRLGYKVLELSKSLLDGIELRQQARPFLASLSQQTNETVHLAVLDRDEVIYIDKVESTQAVRMHSTMGSRSPVHCTSLGKAILAFLPPEERQQILASVKLERRTANTITDRAQLEEHLDAVRLQGFAMDDVENEEGIRCVGAAIFGYSGQVVAAVSVSGPAYRLSAERAREIGVQARNTAASISRQLGHLQ